MTSNVIEFKSMTRPIAQFIRVDGAHGRFGDLYAAGRLPIDRAIFDASRISNQKEFVEALKHDGVEIVLDTEVAELAALAKYQTHVKKAPWAELTAEGVLDSSYFNDNQSQANIIRWIAKFAVQHHVDTVLSPTHFLGDRKFDKWLDIDLRSCIALRKALDSEGGSHIAIDYPIIHLHTALNRDDFRKDIIERIADLPIDNVWFRASGLGSEPKPQTAKQILASLYDFQQLKKPLIMDHTDGLMAQALLAFGGVSGIAHGIGERGTFNAASWHKIPQERDTNKPFGRTIYIPIPRLGRRLSKKELQVLASAKGGKKHLGCQDLCCQHGVSDMLTESRQHAAFQAIAPIQKMSKIPDFNRENYFIEQPLRQAEQLARNIKDLNPSKVDADNLGVKLESLKKRMTEHHSKIGKFSDALSLLHDERGAGGQRAIACSPRNLSLTNTKKRGG